MTTMTVLLVYARLYFFLSVSFWVTAYVSPLSTQHHHRCRGNHHCGNGFRIVVQRHAVRASDEPSSSSSSSIRRSRQKQVNEITLYDIMGASPKDTPEQLKRRYQTLAKRLHPDIVNRNNNNSNNNNNNDTGHPYDMSDINAAWEILGDKKERLRYDRSLQAKEFTDGVEALVGLGIQTAIPWLKKTADTTVAAVDATAAAVDASAKAAQVGAEQAKYAYGIFELEQKSRQLEQRAVAEQKRADKLQQELENLPKQRITYLQQDARKKGFAPSSNSAEDDAVLTFLEAQRLLKSFQGQSPPITLVADLQSLKDTENGHRESIKTRQSMERASQMATRKLDQAQLAEIQAQRHLEEAQQALLDAQQKHSAAQQLQIQAVSEQTESIKIVQKMEQSLQKTQQKVKAGLYQQQEQYLDCRSKELKVEKALLEASAKNLQAEALAIKTEAQRLERSR